MFSLASMLLSEEVRQARLSRILLAERRKKPDSQNLSKTVECCCNEIPYERLKILGETGKLWRFLSLTELNLPKCSKIKDPDGFLLSWCSAAAEKPVTRKRCSNQKDDQGSATTLEFSSIASSESDHSDDISSNENDLDLWKIWNHDIDQRKPDIVHGSVIPHNDPIEGLLDFELPFFIVDSLLTESVSGEMQTSSIVDVNRTSLIMSQAPTFSVGPIGNQTEFIYRVIPRTIPSALCNNEWFHR